MEKKPIKYLSLLKEICLEPIIQEKILREIEVDWLRKKKKTSRYNIKLGSREIKILSIGEENFLVENSEAVGLRGLVSVFKGSEQIFDCLIVRSEDFGHAACFEYKRKTRTNTKPAKDFALDPDHPIGSLPSN